MSGPDFTFLEFFAGGGMARLGLGPGWRPVFVNDCDPKKAAAYRAYWGAGAPVTEQPVQQLDAQVLPGPADLAWASFPCQDLSLAGAGKGLRGERSGTFWAFWGLMQALSEDGRAPRLIALENVCGTLTSHGGQDFKAIGDALAGGGYRFGALVIDAADFLPQSRPRLFIIATRHRGSIPAELANGPIESPFHPAAVKLAHQKLSPAAQSNWVWWRLPAPPRRDTGLRDCLEPDGPQLKWQSTEKTAHLLSLMSERNRAKLAAAQLSGQPQAGTVFRRTRRDAAGKRRQRAEVRFDGVAGCLRTPGGGSSRQTLIEVNGESIRTRLLSPREAARLMGLPDDYPLPARATDAYHLAGDGVVVPVVRHIAQHLLEPLLAAESSPPANPALAS